MMGGVKDEPSLNLESELERSREEILQLAERVKRLVSKRNEREALVQRLRRSGSPRPVPALREAFHLCSLCATDHASAAIEHVRACAPGSRCDHCGEAAIMWIELKMEGAVEVGR